MFLGHYSPEYYASAPASSPTPRWEARPSSLRLIAPLSATLLAGNVKGGEGCTLWALQARANPAPRAALFFGFCHAAALSLPCGVLGRQASLIACWCRRWPVCALTRKLRPDRGYAHSARTPKDDGRGRSPGRAEEVLRRGRGGEWVDLPGVADGAPAAAAALGSAPGLLRRREGHLPPFS